MFCNFSRSRFSSFPLLLEWNQFRVRDVVILCPFIPTLNKYLKMLGNVKYYKEVFSLRPLRSSLSGIPLSVRKCKVLKGSVRNDLRGLSSDMESYLRICLNEWMKHEKGPTIELSHEWGCGPRERNTYVSAPVAVRSSS